MDFYNNERRLEPLDFETLDQSKLKQPVWWPYLRAAGCIIGLLGWVAIFWFFWTATP